MIARFLCRIGWHNWLPWRDRYECAHDVWHQTRECIDCRTIVSRTFDKGAKG